ncbi:MAG: DUF3307 domain-containing protein [Flavobacteriales bacterium]|nr:DUF3307 domain-containing protein [Flavobacteriales bacterium]
MGTLIFIKLLLAHLVGDFLLQSKATVEDKRKKKAASIHLYMHGVMHAALAWLLLFDWQYWWVAMYIFLIHTLIDTFKLYFDKHGRWHCFVIDQALHIVSILLVWCWINDWTLLSECEFIFSNENFFVVATAYLFVSWPVAYLMKSILRSFHFKKVEADESLQNAGQAIGILERILTLTFILTGQYEVIGYLITAKSLLRFREGTIEEPRIQTEYLIIGTLLSFLFSLVVGLSVKAFGAL